MAEDHGPRIKDDATYEAVLEQGSSPGKAARIANAKAAGTLKRDGTPIEERSVAALRAAARRIDIEGRSKMKKAELAAVIRGNG